MNNNLTRARRVLPDHSRPIVASDLVPIATALDMLSQYHNRPFTLADIQRVYNEGGHITPVFWYEGKSIIYDPRNPFNLDDNDIARYDYVTDDTYSNFFKLWARSSCDITDIYGYFTVDFRAFRGLPFGSLINFTTYLDNPIAKVIPKAILQIPFIHEHTTWESEIAFFPVDFKMPYSQAVTPMSVKPTLEIGLHDWFIPKKQIERLHPNYKIIYLVDGVYYDSVVGDDGFMKRVKINIDSLEKPFYAVIKESPFNIYNHLDDLTKYADEATLLELLENEPKNNTANAKPKAKNINPSTIGHNGKAGERKALAQNLASEIWENHDPSQLLRIGKMASLVTAILSEKHPKLFSYSIDERGKETTKPTPQTVKSYLSEIKQEYASIGGQDDITTERQINQLTNHIKQLYKTGE